MKDVKANFNNIYSLYYPTEYVNNLIGHLKYELPFHAIARLKHYQKTLLPNDLLRVTIIGSGHGVDAAALKFNVNPHELLARWKNDATVMLSFPSQSKYEITMIDIEAEPLRFASDIKLCEKFFVANMQQPYSVQLEQHLNEMTDIVICIGATGYIGVDGVEKIIHSAFVNGKAKLFCFSVVKHLDASAYVEVCLKHGLVVRTIGNNFRQRYHKDEAERQKIHNVLEQKNLLTQADEEVIRCDVFLAGKPEIFSTSDEDDNA